MNHIKLLASLIQKPSFQMSPHASPRRALPSPFWKKNQNGEKHLQDSGDNNKNESNNDTLNKLVGIVDNEFRQANSNIVVGGGDDRSGGGPLCSNSGVTTTGDGDARVFRLPNDSGGGSSKRQRMEVHMR